MIYFNKTASAFFLKQTLKNSKKRFEGSKNESFTMRNTNSASKKGLLTLPEAVFDPPRDGI